MTLRGDDVTEIMAFYLQTFGKPIPNSLRRAIGEVMGGFDEYTLAKYKGSGKAVKMRDLLCLCRPKPKDAAQAALWKRCLENKLATPVTWETELSAKGNSAATWKALIDSDKVGYMALLRNLRNIITANPSNIGKVYRTIENPEAVRRAKQLPFRYLSAYKSVENIAGSHVLAVLERAAALSVANMPRLSGTTVIAVDTSGSMYSRVSAKSDVSCAEIAMLLGLMANRICENSIFYTFDTEIVKERVSEQTLLLSECRQFRGGGGTDMGLPFKKMLADRVKADRLIILSDNECNWPYGTPVQALADQYRKASGRDLWVHAIDLQGYGTQQFAGSRTNLIAGWSEKVLDFIGIAETGQGSLEKAIAAYQW